MSHEKNRKISLWSIVLIIIATEFGFSNIVTGYNQMGYASIIWYIITSIIFLFPLVMIFAEYSGSLESDHGGFYSWLINSIGEKGAFIGTFCWIGMILINVLQNCSGIGINLSGIVYGQDVSEMWKLGPLNSNEIEALLGIMVIIVATAIATRGVHQIAIISTIAGIISLSVITIFVIASLVIFFANGHLAQPISGEAFIKAPNPQFQSPIAIMSFIVYAMFAYGGIESSSGLIDKMKNPRKNYPKAVLIVAGVMTFLYVLGIFICGLATNWTKVMGSKNVNLYNNSFYLMQNLGDGLVKAFGGSNALGIAVGAWLNRILSIGSVVPLFGLLIVVTYSPIKGLIAGSSKDLWPKRVAHFNRHDVPSFAMWIECALIVISLLLISLTGKNGQQFYQIIVDMGNIGTLLPYIFIVIAFIAFKKRKDLSHPIVFFHSKASTYAAVTLLLASMAFAIVMNFIEPVQQHQYSVAFWTFAGPILFLIISTLMYHFGIHHRAKRMIIDNVDYEKANQ